jgi:hypothetical protein
MSASTMHHLEASGIICVASMSRTELQNPYDSPRSIDENSSPRLWLAGVRRVGRIVALAVAGYAAFTGFVLFYRLFGFADFVNWDTGIVCSLAFASSEAFNFGRGKATGVLRRIIVAVAVVISSAIIAGLMSEPLGLMEGRTYTADPWATARIILWLIVFAVELIIVRHWWIRSPTDTSSS